MILQRIQIDLVGPDEWPRSDEEYAAFQARELHAKFLFRDHLRLVLDQLRTELADEFDIEADSLRWGDEI